jgi:hypothetical protein
VTDGALRAILAGIMAPPSRGGPSNCGGIAPSVFRELLAYVTCPRCGQQIREPFSRSSGPVPYLHYGRGSKRACRIIVHPDAVGEKHITGIIPEDVSLELGFVRYVLARRRAA